MVNHNGANNLEGIINHKEEIKMKFSYKRNTTNTGNLEEHTIGEYQAYGENLLNAPDVSHFRLSQLYDKANAALARIKNTIDANKKLDLSDYKPEMAEKLQQDKIHTARKSLLDIIKQEIFELNQNISNLENRILKETEPVHSDSRTENLLMEMKMQEIRNHFKGLSIERRNYEINNAVERNNLDLIKAVASSPIDLIDPDRMLTIRKEFAFRNNKDLANAYADATQLAQVSRRKCGALNATAKAMLLNEEISDPVTAQDHFEVFTPRDKHEQWAANRKIEEEIKVELAKDNLHISNIETADQIQQAA